MKLKDVLNQMPDSVRLNDGDYTYDPDNLLVMLSESDEGENLLDRDVIWDDKAIVEIRDDDYKGDVLYIVDDLVKGS